MSSTDKTLSINTPAIEFRDVTVKFQRRSGIRTTGFLESFAPLIARLHYSLLTGVSPI
jgi:hypothetical protein